MATQKYKYYVIFERSLKDYVTNSILNGLFYNKIVVVQQSNTFCKLFFKICFKRLASFVLVCE